MTFRPGTVSKILWHFTGGPLWDDSTNKQLKKLKPALEGYNALKAIIDSKELRLGKYKEIVKVVIPEKKKYNLKQRKYDTFYNYEVIVKSKPVCCVADIPLQHIAYHANRYGKIAIGFHRESIIKAGFNPVMYSLENTDLLNKIYNGYSAIDDIDIYDANSEAERIQAEIDNLIDQYEISDEYIDATSISSSLSYVESAKDDIEDSFENFLAYIKTFDQSEFDSIYCEREWRSTSNFKFSIDDIAIIILPKVQEGHEFYKTFLDEMNLPRSVTIAKWEDLVEH